MYTKVTLLCSMFVCFSYCHPTVYKYNEKKILEPDLVPVSSTVIPLPVYQVSYGLHVLSSQKDGKIKKPDGPITLVTVNNKKKLVPQDKPKPNDVSSIKELS